MSDHLNFEDSPPTAEEKSKHRERFYEPPVAWLLGRQFVNSLKGTLIYAAFGNKLDPRDWMNAQAYTYARAGGEGDCRPDDSACRECPPVWEPRAGAASDPGDFWFDYMSDTGDGMMAVYSLAYLCMSDLWVRDPGDRLPSPEDSRMEKRPTPGHLHMPRGSFLLVGGDTAYHMSDYTTLSNRFQLPFQWAFADLKANLAAQGVEFDEARRPLFGIPGNHDYYDQLDGFRRQFRRTIRPEPPAHPVQPDLNHPQLMVAGFVRCQEASYVALELPHGWWLWGLDTEVPGEIDERQRKFFRQLARDEADPNRVVAPRNLQKLIVATCAPTTVFGKFADRDDEKSSRAFFQLGLPRPFLEPDKLEEGEPQLTDTQCRLDISGDVHHYARYWGPDNTGGLRVRENSQVNPPPDTPNYASVVSGLGGAFHHPSQTYKGEVEERTLYPSEHVSRREVSKQIFRFWKLINGGGVWLLGLILAFVVYCGMMVSQSSHDFVHSFAFWENGLGVFRREQIKPTVPVVDQQETVKQFWTGDVWRVPALPNDPACAPRNDEEPRCLRDCAPPRYFLGQCAVPSTPGEYKAGIWLMIISLLLVIVGYILGDWLFKDPDEDVIRKLRGSPAETDEEAKGRAETAGAERPKIEKKHWYQERPFQRVALLSCVTIAVALLSLLTLRPYRAHLSPFGNSLIVLLTLIWAVSATVLSVRYSEWLFWKSSIRKITRMDWALTWVLAVFAVFSLGAGLWIFGKNNRAAYLVADIVFALVVLLTAVGLTLIGYSKAGEMQESKLKRIPYGLLGVIHAVLQLATAYIIVRKGTWLTLALLPLIIAAFGFLGWYFMKKNWSWPLLFAWVAHGALVLFLPRLVYGLTHSGGPPFIDHRGLLPFEGWWGLVPALLAGALGALMTCVWLGWYFAVSLGFHGHNNEIAGATRIERFKEFIRFRVSRDGLTGYVIAIDYPKRDGADLTPRLVDVFHICGKAKT